MKKFFIILIIISTLVACGKNQNTTENQNDKNKTNVKQSTQISVPESKKLTFNEFNFDTIDIDGNRIKSSDFYKDSKINALIIWATYGNDCKDTLVSINNLSKNYDEKDLKVSAFILDTSADTSTNIEEAQNIIKENNLNFKNLLPNPTTEDALKTVEKIPLLLIMDSQGKILNAYEGNLSQEVMQKIIDDHLKK
ncbi:MAG: redoxin domain-containing protein [Peptoniphilus lacrimalis]|uniref:redoxin domain-containing protein n=1 Tax=Peptoniphilus lacrimalis TaxID=33031 RepID=UPI00254ACF1C|nr:redoxin domain-containing protein [Peptoniphilus lacrimalis]MDK8281177.1 redoxin domain-containing protein [Peptoniphilus lacrimalis]